MTTLITMDSLDVFVIGWLASLLGLVAASAWWHWFSHEPKWFIGVMALVLVGLIGAIVMMTNGMPAWLGWTTVGLSTLLTIAGVTLVVHSMKADVRRSTATKN